MIWRIVIALLLLVSCTVEGGPLPSLLGVIATQETVVEDEGPEDYTTNLHSMWDMSNNGWAYVYELLNGYDLESASSSAAPAFSTSYGTRGIGARFDGSNDLLIGYDDPFDDDGNPDHERYDELVSNLSGTDKAWSVTFFVRPHSNTKDSIVAEKRGRPANWDPGWYLYKLDRKLLFALEHWSGPPTMSTLAFQTTGNVLTANVWTHIALTYDGSESFGGITLYVDGDSVSLSNTSSGTYTGYQNNTQNLKFGGANQSAEYSTYFDGDMDQIRLYTAELTEAQVEQIMAYDEYNE